VNRYLMIRLKRRWPAIPLSIGLGLFAHFINPLMHPSRPSHPLGEVLFPLGFCLVGILFPFQWGGETRGEY
jgi:hypothetical protein